MAVGEALTKAAKGIVKDSYGAYANPYHGAFSPHVTGAVLGATAGSVGGAVMGAAFSGGANGFEGGMMGAAAGTAVGALAVPALGLAGAGVSKFFTSGGLEKVGSGIVGTGAVAGIGTAKIAKGLNKVLSPVGRRGAHRIANTIAAPIEFNKQTFVKNKDGMLEPKRKFISVNMGDSGLKKFTNISRLGVVGAIAGMALGANKVGQDFYEGRQGNQSVGVRRATPNYLDNAGATGDLVFAMHQNRRG